MIEISIFASGIISRLSISTVSDNDTAHISRIVVSVPRGIDASVISFKD
jgi:hypothetical protein